MCVRPGCTSLVLAAGRAVALPPGGADELVLPARLQRVDRLQVLVQGRGDVGVQRGAAQALHLPQQSHHLRDSHSLQGLTLCPSTLTGKLTNQGEQVNENRHFLLRTAHEVTAEAV